MTGRRLPLILIGVCLVVAGLLIYASPLIIGALEIMRIDREVQHNQTVFFAPTTSSGVIVTGVVGAALAMIGAAIVVAGVVVKVRR